MPECRQRVSSGSFPPRENPIGMNLAKHGNAGQSTPSLSTRNVLNEKHITENSSTVGLRNTHPATMREFKTDRLICRWFIHQQPRKDALIFRKKHYPLPSATMTKPGNLRYMCQGSIHTYTPIVEE